ncbi:MAG: hypothetical protein IJV23_01170 [Prevotella sp.]|nr:hypothetical protein [Prevotella sp.]
MKQKILHSIAFFIIGVCVGGIIISAVDANKVKNNEQAIIDNGRMSMIEFNKEYNKLYNDLGYLAIGENNDFAKVTMNVLLKLTPKLIEVNKSLKLDCTDYKNGAPVSIQDENGRSTPLEKLPEEIKILK